MVTPWSNDQTRQIALWLEREDVRQQVEKLVKIWNDEELLISDLSSVLQRMVYDAFGKIDGNMKELEDVDWLQLAEKYAFEMAGVDDDEAEARYQRERDRQ